MKVPKYLHESFPEFNETFAEIEVHLVALEKSKLAAVHPKVNKTILPRTVFQFLVYNQIVLHRVIGLSHSILQAWESKNVPTAFVLLRTLYENTSVVFDANLRLKDLIAQKDFDGIYKLIFNLLYATRVRERIKGAVESEMEIEGNECKREVSEKELEQAYTAQQILNVMDRISKVFPDHRMIYESMCEYAHPNHDALLGLYGKWKDKFTIEISESNGMTKDNISICFWAFAFSLKMFVEGYDAILTKFNDIIELSNEDLRQEGRDTTGYDKVL